MKLSKLKIIIFIFALFSFSLIFSQQSDTIKPNPCDSKSDCSGCNCYLNTNPQYTLGIDLAFQGIEGGLADIKWDTVLANPGIKFILLKKSTGCDTSTKKVKQSDTLVTRVKVSIDNDKFFYENWKFLKSFTQASGKQIHLGIYHYFYNNVSAKLQAEMFLKNMFGKDDSLPPLRGGKEGLLSDYDLPPVLDLEDTAMSNTDSKTLGENIINWIELVEKSTGRKVIIYTSRYYWDKYRAKLNNETLQELYSHPLWQAQFNIKKDKPDVLNGWNSWNFWQYCGDCFVNGIKGELDVNVFNGTDTDLNNFINDSIIK